MRNNSDWGWNKISVTEYGVYLVLTIVLGGFIGIHKTEIFLLCGNRPRYMQLVWIFGLIGITVWKTAGYYILRKVRSDVLILCSLQINIILFIPQYRILAEMGMPMSLSLVALIVLGLIDIVQLEKKAKKAYRIMIMTAYPVAGLIYMLISGSRVLWEQDYSIFSHLYMLIVCFALFYILSGKCLEIIPAFVRKLLGKLSLDD